MFVSRAFRTSRSFRDAKHKFTDTAARKLLKDQMIRDTLNTTMNQSHQDVIDTANARELFDHYIGDYQKLIHYRGPKSGEADGLYPDKFDISKRSDNVKKHKFQALHQAVKKEANSAQSLLADRRDGAIGKWDFTPLTIKTNDDQDIGSAEEIYENTIFHPYKDWGNMSPSRYLYGRRYQPTTVLDMGLIDRNNSAMERTEAAAQITSLFSQYIWGKKLESTDSPECRNIWPETIMVVGLSKEHIIGGPPDSGINMKDISIFHTYRKSDRKQPNIVFLKESLEDLIGRSKFAELDKVCILSPDAKTTFESRGDSGATFVISPIVDLTTDAGMRLKGAEKMKSTDVSGEFRRKAGDSLGKFGELEEREHGVVTSRRFPLERVSGNRRRKWSKPLPLITTYNILRASDNLPNKFIDAACTLTRTDEIKPSVYKSLSRPARKIVDYKTSLVRTGQKYHVTTTEKRTNNMRREQTTRTEQLFDLDVKK